VLTTFINDYLKLVFIMTPFFVLSSFIAITARMSERDKRRTALKVAAAVLVASYAMFFFGRYIFDLFGITLDAFRIGAGSVLFLSALSLIGGNRQTSEAADTTDVAVVPLAIPITVGPGVIGVLMVMGAEPRRPLELLVFVASLLLAGATIGALLYCSGWMQRLLRDKALAVLQKITGLFVASIAAQIVFTGIVGFLGHGVH